MLSYLKDLAKEPTGKYIYLFAASLATSFLIMISSLWVSYQIKHKPLPQFSAIDPKGKTLSLIPETQPNRLPDNILQWASKAAISAYTFDFLNYQQQINSVRPYFTETGWNDYLQSVNTLIRTLVQNQLFISSIVSDAPVFSHQGVLPGKGYTWRVEIPFLVTYQSANQKSTRNFIVVLSIVEVPTNINAQGLGIDQFLMVER